jgi:hypothetical protein
MLHAKSNILTSSPDEEVSTNVMAEIKIGETTEYC